MKTATLILLFIIGAAIPVQGQMAVGYNTDGNTLSLSLNPFSKFWGEFRVNTTQYNQASWSYSDRGMNLTGEYTPMIVISEGVPVIHSVSVGFRLILIKIE